ncbi:tyrosine-type recombinase/integrase, partial [Amycolatopsis sp.]|uniref:tyrosine-type recombinase/integrase n=1 Tax=Amycolatopsis sp. TaxID=37632 RepID=UPI002E0630A8|nr:tyrosine-type recombinase/integrase [Amycolatopsis sp.]
MDVLNEWLQEWVLDLQSGRPGVETIKVYRRSIEQFLDWLSEAHRGVTEPAQVTDKMVKGWMRHLVDQNKADSTRRVRGIAVRKFFDYVVGEPDSGLYVNPAASLELPMPKAPPVPVVPDEILSKLLKSMNGATYVDRRDTVIIRMLLDTGLRRAELAGVNVDDVDLVHQQVLVLGKGGKKRLLPFGAKTALALRKYMRVRASRAAGPALPLLMSVRSNDTGGWRMTPGGVGEVLTRRCEQAGLDHLHPHQLRHTWAHDLLKSGAGESDVERLAGWSSPLMIRRYGASV